MVRIFGEIQPSEGAPLGAVLAFKPVLLEPAAPPNPDWDSLLSRHTAREHSAVIQWASPSSSASRCLFLASPR